MNSRADSIYFSIIVPAYNEENYLVRCLDSIKSQDFTSHFEIIVVDNNSSDSTANVARKMGVRVINESRQGVGYAKNRGVTVAKGNVLVFIDADCVLPKDYLSIASNLILSNPKADAVGGPYVYRDAGAFLRLLTDRLNYFYYYFLVIRLLFGFQSMSGGNMVVKKGVFLKSGGFTQSVGNIIFPEDLEYCRRFAELGFNILYSKRLKIETSGRRVMRSPIKDTINRFVYATQLLFRVDSFKPNS